MVGGSASKRISADFGEEHDLDATKAGQEVEGKDSDPDALAFIKAKKNVDDLQKAKKNEKRITAH